MADENRNPEPQNHEDEEEDEEPLQALRLKALAEQNYTSNNLASAIKYAKRALNLRPNLSGVSEMLTAFNILNTARQVQTPLDYYKMLQIERFSHLNTVKKQYKKLALILHPDKNSFVGSEEAFKLVGEAFGVLSDKIRRKEYDMKLRISMQEAVEAVVGEEDEGVETFWTACSDCRLLHKFEKKYLGHNLVCPSCKKSFKAVEASENMEMKVAEEEEEEVVEEIITLAEMQEIAKKKVSEDKMKVKEKEKEIELSLMENRDNQGGLKKKNLVVYKRKASKKILEGEKNVIQEKSKEKEIESAMVNVREKRERRKTWKLEDSESIQRGEKVNKKETVYEITKQKTKKRKVSEIENLKVNETEEETESSIEKVSTKRNTKKKESLEKMKKKAAHNRKMVIQKYKEASLEIDTVQDFDFHDFDKDRVGRNFKKGQVWALYDEEDGTSKHYALIDEVISVNPFEVRLNWLEGDSKLISWEKQGLRVSCGKFKVSTSIVTKSRKIFSHIVDCERAAKELYMIYPKKGSVWAIHEDNGLNSDDPVKKMNIVVFLTSYSQMHGLSMAYLEKNDKFMTVFQRKSIGSHAIRWVEKDDCSMFLYQIPARKLAGDEVSGLEKESWELDPASIPRELLTIDG